MLVNAPKLRAAKVKLPDFNGFHFYDLALSYESISVGLGCFIAPELLCYHASKGNQQDFDRALKSHEIQKYLSKLFKNRYINTINGRVDIKQLEGSIDLISAARIASKRIDNSLRINIIVRSKFNRVQLLKRALLSIKSFIAASGNESMYRCLVVTDVNSAPDKMFGDIEVVKFKEYQGDSRYYLIYKTLGLLDDGFVWFVDDDDWVFPNVAKEISGLLSSFPENSTLYLDTQYFNESILDDDPSTSSLTPGRYFSSTELASNYSGDNHIPFSGVIFSAPQLKRCLSDKFDDSITYFEDYMIQMLIMSCQDYTPIIFKKLSVGISIRENGQTVTEVDRTRWHVASAAAYYKIIKNSNLFMHPQPCVATSNHSTHNKISLKFLPTLIKVYCAILAFKYKIMKRFSGRKNGIIDRSG